jgi:hypothetical protein
MISAAAGNMIVHHNVSSRLRASALAAAEHSSRLDQARGVSRTKGLSNERPQALTPQYVGPARSAARVAALGEQKLLSRTLETYYRDLASGLQAGPKPASAVAAETRYLEARSITG